MKMVSSTRAGVASEVTMFRSEFLFVAVALAACSGNKGTDTPGSSQNSSVAGVWVGSEGPNQNALKPTAKLELNLDGGLITGIWYSKDPSTGSSNPVAFLAGTQDGGTLHLATSPHFGGGQLSPGAPFTVNMTSPTHIEATTQFTRIDGGILPIYLKLDRTP